MNVTEDMYLPFLAINFALRISAGEEFYSKNNFALKFAEERFCRKQLHRQLCSSYMNTHNAIIEIIVMYLYEY